MGIMMLTRYPQWELTLTVTKLNTDTTCNIRSAEIFLLWHEFHALISMKQLPARAYIIILAIEYYRFGTIDRAVFLANGVNGIWPILHNHVYQYFSAMHNTIM
jgi:hypothetical protein